MAKEKYVIIMAAGSGTRMGAEMPKQFLLLEGKPILQHTMEVFLNAVPDIHIITVLPSSHMDYWKTTCLERNFIAPQLLVKGGITRFHSVKNALSKVPAGALVAVHDGVRPLVSPELVNRLFKEAESADGVIPVLPCVDTIKVLAKEGDILKSVPGATADRSVLFGAQTPQIFCSDVLKSAYEQPFDSAFTDDASVVDKYGKSLSYVIGERLNIKITTKEDLLLAEAVLSLKKI